MKNFKLKVLSTVAALSLAVSCGKDSGSGSSGGPGGSRQAQEPAPVDGSNIEGHYQAKFITMNPHVNGTIPGSANFQRKEDKLYVYVRLFAGGVRAWHMQHVYTGGRCPTMKDDSNGDGFLDIQEAEKVLGKILIPLDSNISTQSAGRRFFPLADLSGYYHYERITSFRRFLQDLQDEDRDPEDDLVKLAAGEGLRIAGKTVLIQGVVETVDLPETVASKGRHAAFQTLPVACGVFRKVDQEPGTPYVMDRIPGPIADVVEGQDRPAEEDIPETTGGTSGTTGSGTNDSDDGEGPVSDGEGRTSGGSSTGGSTSGSSSGSSTGSSSSGSSSTSGGSSSGSTSGGTSSGSESTSGSTTGSSGESSSSSTTTGGSSTTTTTTSSSSSSSSSIGSTTGGVFGF